MPIFTAEYLLRACTDLFAALGAPRAEAHIAAQELVESSLMGFDSHGVMRAAQYARDIGAGRIKPGSPIAIVAQTPTTATVDCGLNFGAVSALRMVGIAVEKAHGSGGIACVVSQNSHHVGRLGAWPQQVAEHGLIGLAFVSNTKGGHSVAPWGGREGRLGTNPIAWAAPTSTPGRPVLMDMATCAMPEGKIRVHLHAGKQLPSGCILDADGHPSTEPKDFYGPPRGAILPFGGANGHKGFGLALLVELMGGMLAGYATRQEATHANGLCLIAIDPDAFCGRERLVALTDDVCDYITTVPLMDGFNEVVMPGTIDFRVREQRARDGIPLADESWRLITEAAAGAGLML